MEECRLAVHNRLLQHRLPSALFREKHQRRIHISYVLRENGLGNPQQQCRADDTKVVCRCVHRSNRSIFLLESDCETFPGQRFAMHLHLMEEKPHTLKVKPGYPIFVTSRLLRQDAPERHYEIPLSAAA